MNKKIEKQLRMIEASITLFRQMRLTSQSLKQVLIDSYNLLENGEQDIKNNSGPEKIKTEKES